MTCSDIFLTRVGQPARLRRAMVYTRISLTQWETTPEVNVRVTNDTSDLFRFFDAPNETEFLSACVLETVRNTLPREVEYLRS